MTAIQLTRVEDVAIAVPAVRPVTLMVAAYSHPGHAPRERLDLVRKHVPLTAVAPGLKMAQCHQRKCACSRTVALPQYLADSWRPLPGEGKTAAESVHAQRGLQVGRALPGVADVAVVDHQAAALCIGQQPTHGGQAGVLLPKAILVRAVHLSTQWLGITEQVTT